MSKLADHHLKMLATESAISQEMIERRGYFTVTDPKALTDLGFSLQQARPPGLVLPLYRTDGQNGLHIYRPDSPRVHDDNSKKLPDGTHKQKVIKYEFPKGSKMALDCPPVCQAKIGDPSNPLWITEGQKKADSLASRGLCALALLGVWTWRGKNDADGLTALPDWNHVALNGRNVYVVFDSDVLKKPEVRKALESFQAWLRWKKANVRVVYLPQSTNGKTGVDDYLAAGHSVDDLLALVEAPRPAPQPIAPVVELLDAAPLAIRRPLSLLDGQAYAATWLYVRVTRSEGLDKEGNIIKYDPPIVETDQRPFILDSAGKVYGPGGDGSIDELGIEVHLPEIPQSDRLLATPAVKSYRAGKRPNPVEVFNHVADVIDRFIDFDRSLADQRTMSEMITCYILATWFLDAFNVIGFLWPNGDRGSGKTQLITLIAELSYLGQVILAGGSFASLRDLADYGATLAFDDAENLSDPKKTDPDKRALLLAGNRRGNTVPLKEPAANGTWRTRHVNTFCPRLFSAIRLPDDVLASRTIIVPLIRTPDRHRANADVLEYGLWPHDRRKLIDDLWSLALAHLAELPKYENRVNQDATLTGRNLEPWRALLAVALWLDEKGVAGLWQRMEALSQSYQSERPELETSSLTVSVIQVLCQLVDCANCANQANCAKCKVEWTFNTSQITEEVIKLGDEADNDDDPKEDDEEKRERKKYFRRLSQRVGLQFKNLRLEKPPRPGGKGPRLWKITCGQLEKMALSYGLQYPRNKEDTLPSEVGTLGILGTLGITEDSADSPTVESADTFTDDTDLLQGEL